MNKPAAIISVGIGAAFLALQSMFPYQVIVDNLLSGSLGSLLATDQSKARAAVSKLLVNPASAEFDAVRTVELEKARYVCGKINGKNRSGNYAGNREFVYDVRNDYARIDDDGTISKSHAAFKPCPVIEDDKSSPQALEMAKKLAKSVPQKDLLQSDLLKNIPSSQSQNSLTAGAPDAQKGASQTSGPVKSAAAAQRSSFNASLGNEGEWQSDRPPTAWPKFPSGDALSEPARKRTNTEAISFASDVDARWSSYKAGQTKVPPTANEITGALRTLLAINPESPEFPRAWELFVRLRKADREVNANRPR